MPDKYTWAPVEVLHDGHRLFPLASDPFHKVAIADDSGPSPEQTDDGVLWLDMHEPLCIDTDEDPHREIFYIPIINDNGKKSYTIGNARTLITLSQMLNWKIQIGRDFYGVHSKE